MQIVEINDPDDKNTETFEYVVGIDFGTTNSLIAISIDQVVNVIKSPKNQDFIPSLVVYNNENIKSIKRLFGKTIGEINNSKVLSSIISKNLLVKVEDDYMPKWRIDDVIISPAEVASKIFLELKSYAEHYLKQPISKAVVTLPAYYDNKARYEVMTAAKLAGFEVLRLLSEPTAAAYAYKLDKKVSGNYVVYDLGGGTFDISLLHMNAGVLQVISIAGDNMLGGDDIDLLIYEYWKKQYQLDDHYKNLLLPIAKQAKESFSETEIFSYNFDFLNIEITLSKNVFELLIDSLIQKTIFLLKKVISEANVDKIEGIILVGGSTRISLIKKKLRENFAYPVLDDIDPDKVVVIGAALQAENLISDKKILLIDAVPLSLGIELYGGIVERIIPRNSPIPYISKKQYTTFLDNQDAIEIHVVQGEREFAKDCCSLVKFSIDNLPKKKAGLVKIEVIFSIDVNGVLSVSANEPDSKRSYSVILKPSYGLTKEEIDQILHNAYKNIKTDFENKNLQEVITQAEKLVYDVSNLIKNIRVGLSDKQITVIDDLITQLQLSIKFSEIEKIIKNTQELNSEILKISEVAISIIEEQIKGQKIKI